MNFVGLHKYWIPQSASTKKSGPSTACFVNVGTTRIFDANSFILITQSPCLLSVHALLMIQLVVCGLYCSSQCQVLCEIKRS